MVAKKVFISFASPQATVAKKIYDVLKRRKIDAFYSNESVDPDDIAVQRIRKEMSAEGLVFVPLFSDDYFDEHRMSMIEYNAFINAHRGDTKGRMCAVRLDGCNIHHLDANYQWQEASSTEFTKHLRKVTSAIISVVNTDVNKPYLAEDPKAAEAAMKQHLIKEWDRIVARAEEQVLTTQSMSHIAIFGWLAACGIDEPKLNPIISAHYISYIVNSMFKLFKDKNRHRVNIECGTSDYVSNLCTIRFLCYCLLVASGEKDYPTSILDAILSGLKRRDFTDQKYLNQALELSSAFASAQTGASYSQAVSDLILSLAVIAKNLNISLNDLWLEEQSSHRSKERMNKNAIIVSHNTVTHHITMFIEDREGAYYRIMELVRHSTPPFNTIRSISETLVPEKIASIRLDINSKDKDIGQKIRDAIKSNLELDRLVFSVTAESV